MAAIEAHALTKDFDGARVVDSLSLDVAAGETLALLGPNGAGKSTTVAMLTTLLEPTSGEARVAGYDVRTDPHGVRAAIGVVFQGPSLENQLSARQNLAYHARLYKMRREAWQPRAEELLKLVELAERADEPVHKFSGGMRRRLEIARAVLHEPRVLFLDEPTTGLDPQARLHAWDMLATLQEREDMAILLTTHHMEEAERLADRVTILDHGRLLASGTSESLRGSLGAEVVRLTVISGRAKLEKSLAALNGHLGIQGIAWQGEEVRVSVASADRALPKLLEVANKSAATLAGIEVHRPTLEDVFIARTGRKLRDQP